MGAGFALPGLGGGVVDVVCDAAGFAVAGSVVDGVTVELDEAF